MINYKIILKSLNRAWSPNSKIGNSAYESANTFDTKVAINSLEIF